MSTPPMWRRYLRFLGSDPPADLEDEIRCHLEMRAERLVREGWEPAAARVEAERRFGDVGGVRRECSRIDGRLERRRRAGVWLDGLGQDLRYAGRALRKNPAFTLIAAGTLGLGIGTSVTMFGVVDALFLRPPAGVSAPDEVALLYVVRDAGNLRTPGGAGGSYPEYLALRSVPGVRMAAAHLGTRPVNVGLGMEAVRANGELVTPEWFSVLGVAPHRGRLFVPGDGDAGAAPTVVLSHSYWTRAFGGDAGAVGRTLRVNGVLALVVGVTPPGFAGIGSEPVDLWLPSGAAVSLGLAWEGWTAEPMAVMLGFVARLQPRADRAAVERAAAFALRPPAEYLRELDPTPEVIASGLSLASRPGGAPFGNLSLWFALATGLVLVISTANVANLLLARSTSRRREVAIRVAVGVGSARLLRTLLMESLLLAALAGLIGLAVAAVGLSLARALPLPPGATTLHPRLLLATTAAVLVTAIAVGAAPAIRMLALQPADELRAAGGQEGRRQHRLRLGLVGAQVAFATVALIGAGLFVRSLNRVTAIEPGVEVERVAVLGVDLSQTGRSPREQRAFQRAALQRLERVPGVVSASLASQPPLGGMGMAFGALGRGGTPLDTQEGPYFISVGEDYFRTVGLPMRQGRAFVPQDRTGARPVAVVNETLARLASPDGPAVGACIPVGDQMRGGGCTEIVGVVADNLHRLFDDRPMPYLYLPALDDPGPADPTRLILVRTAGPAREHLSSLRAAVQSMSPELPFVEAQALAAVLSDDLLPFQLGAYLSTGFGALALLITAVGLYGVLSFLTAQRTVEIGIRRALGASNSQVARLVARGTALPVAAGALVGLAAALAGGTVVASLLYSTAPSDAVSVGAAMLLLGLTAAVAAYVPIRRALRVDPAVALRND